MRPRLLIIWLLLSLGVAHAEWTPERSNRLVNDYSGVLTSEQVAALEQRLVAFDDSTSNQVLVVITPSLYDDEVQATAQRIGERWGVGREQFNNGVVILVKSKTPEENWGEVAIATGYGVEGALPDIFCKHIIDDEMVGPMGEGDYYRGLTRALDVICPVLAGEYSYAQYRADNRREGMITLLVLALVVGAILAYIVYYAKKHPDQFNNDRHWGGGGVYFGGTPGGFWSSEGGGFSSGGFGGFGGFGGGHFGGGGASGRF